MLLRVHRDSQVPRLHPPKTVSWGKKCLKYRYWTKIIFPNCVACLEDCYSRFLASDTFSAALFSAAKSCWIPCVWLAILAKNDELISFLWIDHMTWVIAHVASPYRITETMALMLTLVEITWTMPSRFLSIFRFRISNVQ